MKRLAIIFTALLLTFSCRNDEVDPVISQIELGEETQPLSKAFFIIDPEPRYHDRYPEITKYDHELILLSEDLTVDNQGNIAGTNTMIRCYVSSSSPSTIKPGGYVWSGWSKSELNTFNRETIHFYYPSTGGYTPYYLNGAQLVISKSGSQYTIQIKGNAAPIDRKNPNVPISISFQGKVQFIQH